MEDERRRKRGLTPISGELQAQAEWTPPEQVVERKPRRPEKQPPTTTGGMLVNGLKRLALVVGGISTVAVAVSLGIVFFAEAEAAATFPVVFYVAGAFVAGGGLWSVLGAGVGPEFVPETGYEQLEKESWVSDVFTYFGLGASVIAIGVGIELLL